MTYLAPDESALKWLRYTYDALSRITRITKPDTSAVNNSYSGWTTTVIDENSHTKVFTKDAYDRLTNVVEKNNQDYTTKYKYDCLDNLALITDHSGNQTEFFYDSLKRRIRMQDPDMGLWVYDYDNNGNPIKTTNAKLEVINYSYDELNRLTLKDYAVSSGIEVTYKYDEPASANGIGRRTGMQDLSGSSAWNYDKEGRMVKLEKVVDGNAYKIEWFYDALDRIKSMFLPNLKTVNFSYNNAGLVKNIDGYVASTSYNAASLPVAISFANPMAAQFEYYPDTQRLKTIKTGSLQDLSYTYDLAGNVTKIVDMVRPNSKDYVYDALDRLISGDGNNYEYNAIGNLIKLNQAAQEYTSGKPHALTKDGVNIYAYDACGNMLSGAGRSISYDSENRPISIIKDGMTTQFVYDGDGKRVKKIVKGSSLTTATIYIENLYEKETSQ